MLYPGSKGWIKKYFSMLTDGEINIVRKSNLEIDHKKQLHLLSGKSGLVFAYPSNFLFVKPKQAHKWTNDEKLKIILFETLLLIFIQKNGISEKLETNFIDTLYQFYNDEISENDKNNLIFWTKENKIESIENVLRKKIEPSKKFIDNLKILETNKNTFVFLEVILFNRFINNEAPEIKENYTYYAYNSLIAILLAAISDKVIDNKERKLFEAFYNASNLGGLFKSQILDFLKNEERLSFDSFLKIHAQDKLFCRFLLDLSLLTIYINQDVDVIEHAYIRDLCVFLNLDHADLDESVMLIENFLLNNNINDGFLSSRKSYEKAYSRFVNRWTKVVLRNKDKLANELSESKELVALIKKSTVQDLSNKEKERMKNQFKDLVKSVPALAIFMLPGGAILLPIVLKILPDLIPSAFQDNKVD